jgi:endonuclease III
VAKRGSRLARLLDALEEAGGPVELPPARGALELVLWENAGYLVDDEKRAIAFAELKRKVGLKPRAILAAKRETLLAVAKKGGMHPDGRVEKWLEIARLVEEEFEGNLEPALDLPTPKALRAFERFPSIGRPGAEKILLFTGRSPVLALESNGLRALLRLGYGEESKSYATTYRSVREAVAPEIREDCSWLTRAHLLLRRHGQALCKRTEPLCDECALAGGCPHAASSEGT